MLTAQRARSLFAYDESTGDIVWRRRRGSACAGRIAGNKTKRGHLQTSVDGSLYLNHRLAWLITYGEWPHGDIDHINRVPSDNRLANLRTANRTQNIANSAARRMGRLGLKGAFWRKDRQCWASRIRAYGQQHHLGFFDSAEEAAAAYARAADNMHGCFALTKATAGPDCAAVHAATALVDQADGEETD